MTLAGKLLLFDICKWTV